jgi:hypothetical protein
MNDYSWMYRVSLERLRNMDYCNEVENFTKYTLSNPKIISGGGIRYLCKSCKNKKFINLNVITMYLLQKGFLKKYLCLFTYGEPYVPYETMIERMVRSTYSSSNVYGVIDDNNNNYRCMVIDEIMVMQMNVQL